MVEKPEPLFVVYPTVNKDGYSVQAVPLKKDSQEIRKSFPKSWCGKTDTDLEKVSGIKGAKFCHNSGFLAGAYYFEGAIKLAEKALL